MKFKVSEDVDAPQAMVWAAFTDFSAFESDARGRGATVTRVGNWATTVEGVEWRGEVTIRGKVRAISSKVSVGRHATTGRTIVCSYAPWSWSPV